MQAHPNLLAEERLPEAAPKGDIWKRRFGEINDWVQSLVENGICVVEVLLNLSKGDKAKRFHQRIDHPAKNWKFSTDDIRERQHWKRTQRPSTRCSATPVRNGHRGMWFPPITDGLVA